MDSFNFVGRHAAQAVPAPPLFYRHGSQLLQQDPPEGTYEEATMDAGLRICEVLGVSPTYMVPNDYKPGTQRQQVVVEFIVIRSRKWEGCRVKGFYPIPKDWSDERSRMGDLASALLGHPIGDGEPFDLKQFILDRTPIRVDFALQTSGSGNAYMKPVRHLPLGDDDDVLPEPVAAQPRATSARTVDDHIGPSYAEEPDEIPF